jgi:hypothetical protein
MNKFKYSLLTMTLGAIIFASSCQKVLDINTDPNNLNTAKPEFVLPAAQQQMAVVISDQFDLVGAVWGQYWTGGYGVSTSSIENYNMTFAQANAGWRDSYSQSLKDFNYLIESGEPRYAGVAKISSAYIFQLLVDLYGDIPFDEALQGDKGIISPKYNTEQEVYSKLIPLIDQGIRDLDSISPSPSIVFRELGNEDLFYGGNKAKWKAFANTLKLKILVRSNSNSAAINLLNSGVPLISNSSDDFKFRFYESNKNVNPIYNNFVNTTNGNYYVATKSSIDLLTSLSDPRIRKIYTVGSAGDSGVYSGNVNVDINSYPSGGVNTKFSRPNTTYVYGPLIPVFLLSSWESKFLQAETLIRNGQDASSLLEAAIAENFSYYDLTSTDASDYFNTLGFDPSSSIDDQINILAVQKWISMNGLQMTEGWIESVRFDRAGNTIFKNIFTSPSNNSLGAGVYPSSFVYPSSEINSNPNVPRNRVVTDRRFWDN